MGYARWSRPLLNKLRAKSWSEMSELNGELALLGKTVWRERQDASH